MPISEYEFYVSGADSAMI